MEKHAHAVLFFNGQWSTVNGQLVNGLGRANFLLLYMQEKARQLATYCLLLALLLCFHSSGINKKEQGFSKFSKQSEGSES